MDATTYPAVRLAKTIINKNAGALSTVTLRQRSAVASAGRNKRDPRPISFGVITILSLSATWT